MWLRSKGRPPMRSGVCFLLQVDDDAGFSSSEWDETTTGFEYALPIELSGGTYTWRVRVVNASEVGDWS